MTYLYKLQNIFQEVNFIARKIIIQLDDSHNTNVYSELSGQELYEAYVAFTAHIAINLNNISDIKEISKQASLDAIKMIDILKKS